MGDNFEEKLILTNFSQRISVMILVKLNEDFYENWEWNEVCDKDEEVILDLSLRPMYIISII